MVDGDFVFLKSVDEFFGQAHVAQLAEHILGKDEVTSSILVMGSRNIFLRLAFEAVCINQNIKLNGKRSVSEN